MNRFRSILSAAFAFLVLFSSSNFMIGIHLCGGEIQNIALFGKADGCEKEKKLPPCHRHESIPCCQDETIVHDAGAFKGEVTQINIASLPVPDIAQPPVLLAEIVSLATIASKHYYNYDPPLRSSDLTVTFQSFLI
jgi:hypothetical protein